MWHKSLQILSQILMEILMEFHQNCDGKNTFLENSNGILQNFLSKFPSFSKTKTVQQFRRNLIGHNFREKLFGTYITWQKCCQNLF